VKAIVFKSYMSTNYAGTYYLSGSGHLFKSLNFLSSYSNISGFYIVVDIGHPLLWHYCGLNGLYVFSS
jgi:hypothetical protein